MRVAALEQDDERTSADAADADDLPGDVDEFELLEQVASVVLAGWRGRRGTARGDRGLGLVGGSP